MDRELLTLSQVSQRTGLAPQTLYNLRSIGGGPPLFLLRRRLRCYRDDLDAWIAAHAVAQH